MIQFVTASHKEEVLKANLLRSTLFSTNGFPPLIIKRNYTNVSKAYNEARPLPGIVVYVHHDVYLPVGFYSQLSESIKEINRIDPDWGVLGVAGVKNTRREMYGNISDRGSEWGNPNNLPHEVDTLDELMIITKGDFKFDENLDQHFYGADVCMQARIQGRKCYAIKAYCEHNSSLIPGTRPASYDPCMKYFKEKYKNHLPIACTHVQL